LIDLISKDGAKSFIATALDENRSMSVTARSADVIRQLLPPKRQEPGSVEGKLETISIHRSKKFVIYESLTGKGVTCIINNDELLRLATESLGQKVVVSGMVSFNIKNEPCRVTVSALRILGRGKLPTVGELFGSDPDFTGNISTDEYIREIRRG
jgi:hypothetical protein